MQNGFVHNRDTEELFEAITEKANDDDEGGEYAFEELHRELQKKHHISLSSVGYSDVDILAAFSAEASSKNMNIAVIEASALTNTEEYTRNIAAFLQELGIDSSKYTPSWYILGYMD